MEEVSGTNGNALAALGAATVSNLDPVLLNQDNLESSPLTSEVHHESPATLVPASALATSLLPGFLKTLASLKESSVFAVHPKMDSDL